MRLVYWLTTLVVATALAVFAVNDGERIAVNLWFFISLEALLCLVALLPLLLGFLMGAFIAWIGGRHWRHDARLSGRPHRNARART